MKVKFANKIYEVLYTKEVVGKTMYAVEDEPNHIDWLVNVEVIDEESKDEKIRKELIKLLRNLFNNYSYFIKDPFYTECINWLEKQGEQNSNILWHDVSEEPDEQREIFCEWKSSIGVWHAVVFYHADSKTFCEGERIITNVLKWTYVNDLLGKQREQKPADEPRLKVEEGKWYVCISQFCNCIEGRVYKATSDNRIIDEFGTEYDMHNDAYKYFRPWTIEDAKDSDILWHSDSASNGIFIFKEIRDDGKVLCYCDYDSEDHFCTGEHHTCCWVTDKCIKPATKEQRELLFQKMKEAGYEWNEEKKELKKLEKQNKQKLIWDKFDDLMLKDMIEFIESGWSGNGKSHLIYWLKSIKDRIK